MFWTALLLSAAGASIIIGVLFDNAPEIPLLRTLDIDFLVPNPSNFKTKVDVSELLNLLRFDSDLDWVRLF